MPTKYQFKEKLRRPKITNGSKLSGSDKGWGFIILAKAISTKLARRGRTWVKITINGHTFQALLEPDGQLSHWFKISAALIQSTGIKIGNDVEGQIIPVEQQPEPKLPPDLQTVLTITPDAKAVWDGTTTLARIDWIHWIESAKQTKTRAKRINNACHMLASGKRRVCCFDPSGYYSKAFGAPKEDD